MHITYRPKGVCSQLFDIDVEDGIIQKVAVKGGCSGNLQGMEGIRCGFKPTSCPDQLAKALKNCI